MKIENPNNKISLEQKYKFGVQYFENPEILKQQIIDKTIIPHQVEFQPGSTSKKICWLDCPYCYGISAIDDGERISEERLVAILNQIADGGVKKVSFAGWATDPLNSKHIDSLLETAINRKLIFGFNTKALKVSDRFIKLLSQDQINSDSWISLSIDSGYNETFNSVHGLTNTKVPLYDRVLKNVNKICENNTPKKRFDVSAAYLINKLNCSPKEVKKFIDDFRNAGCNMLRFSFAQTPKGREEEILDTVPTKIERDKFTNELEQLIKSEDSKKCRVLLIDSDKEFEILGKSRSLPCVARFIYPTVGFDGRLYQCSQSAAPNFKEMELGDLKTRDFWDLYYSYDVENFKDFFSNMGKTMKKLGCRCDRKEHVVNTKINESGLFS